MHYAWIMVWLTFAALIIGSGVRSVSGVILLPLELEFEWSRSSISLAFAVNLILYGVLGPFVASTMQRIGVRNLMPFGMTIIVFSVTVTMFITQIWQFHLMWGVVLGLGSSFFVPVLSATVANRWFEKRRGDDWMIKHIEHVGIMVSNMERSLAFYQKLFDLQLRRREHLTKEIELAFLFHPDYPQIEIELVSKDLNTAEGLVNHLAFRVDDIDVVLQRLKELDVHLDDETSKLILGDVRIAFFKGPDGEKLELVQRE